MKTLIFDFGNVLIDLDYERHFKAFRELFPRHWDQGNYPESIQGSLLKYEKGEISDDTFIWNFQQLDPSLDPLSIVRAWLSLLGEIPLSRLDMLNSLGSDYKIALLSNINNLHLNWIQNYLFKAHGIDDFENGFFDHVFYSHVIGMRKPDQEIYKYTEAAMSVRGEDILFIDDREDNIMAARTAGWNAIQHDPRQEITERIQEYLSLN